MSCRGDHKALSFNTLHRPRHSAYGCPSANPRSARVGHATTRATFSRTSRESNGLTSTPDATPSRKVVRPSLRGVARTDCVQRLFGPLRFGAHALWPPHPPQAVQVILVSADQIEPLNPDADQLMVPWKPPAIDARAGPVEDVNPLGAILGSWRTPHAARRDGHRGAATWRQAGTAACLTASSESPRP
jgi:hypothetical protein